MSFERHLTARFLIWTSLIWLGLSGLIFSASLVEGMALKIAEQGAIQLIQIGMLKTVEFAWLVMPAAACLGALVTGTLAARQGELTGFYSCGGRPVTIMKTWLSAATLWVVLSLVLGEFGVPLSKEVLLGLDVGPERAEALTLERRPVEWVSIENWRVFLPSLSHEKSSFKKPQLLQMKGNRLQYIWDADELNFDGDSWTLSGAVRYALDGERSIFETRKISLPISPQDLWMVAAPPSVLSRSVLRDLTEQRRRLGTDYVHHELTLSKRLGYPLALLPLLALVAPLALSANRKRTFAQALGLGVLVIGVAFSLEGLFRMLTLGRQLSPAWGGWGLTVTVSFLAVISLKRWRRS